MFLSAVCTIWYSRIIGRPLILYSLGCVMRSNYFCILCESLPTKYSRPSLDFPRREYSVRATGISCSQSAKHVVNCAILSFVRFIFPLMFPHYSYSVLSTYCVPSVSDGRKKKNTLVVSRYFNPLPRSDVLPTKPPTGRQAGRQTQPRRWLPHA